MLKKLSEKLEAKFPATTPSCSMVKIGHLADSSLNIFNPKQALEKANHSSKKKTKEKKGGKKHIKSRKALCLGQNVLNTIPVVRTANCRVANAFPTRLELI